MGSIDFDTVEEGAKKLSEAIEEKVPDRCWSSARASYARQLLRGARQLGGQENNIAPTATYSYQKAQKEASRGRSPLLPSLVAASLVSLPIG